MLKNALLILALVLALGFQEASALDIFRVLAAEDLIEEGIAYYEAGEYDDAELKFKEAALELPKGPESYYWIGRVFQARGRYDTARNYFDHALKLDPSNLVTLDRAAEMMLSLNRFNDALPYLRRLADSNPNEPEVYSNLGYAHLGLTNYAEAERHFRKALEIGGDDAKYLDGLGLAFDGLGRLNDAESAFLESIELNPSRGETHFHLALLYTRQGLGRQAITSFNLALRHLRNPAQRLFAYFQLGVIYESLGDLKEAAAAYSAALEIDPTGESAPAIRERLDGLGAI